MGRARSAHESLISVDPQAPLMGIDLLAALGVDVICGLKFVNML